MNLVLVYAKNRADNKCRKPNLRNLPAQIKPIAPEENTLRTHLRFNGNFWQSSNGHALPIILLAIICLLAVVYFSMDFFINQGHEKPIQLNKANITSQQEDGPITSFGSPQKSANDQQTTAEAYSFVGMLISQQLVTPKTISPESCQNTSKGIAEFYQHLEQQGFSSNTQGEPMKSTFIRLTAKLLKNPPVVIRETDNLMNILKNAAHFFRILGEKDLNLLRAILKKEDIRLEDAMALFYNWSLVEGYCEDKETEIRLPLAEQYEYATFFLNTLGGQSYLYRRNHNIRTLLKYYVVLLLDRANDEMKNRHGIDIRPPLLSVLADLEIARDLHYRNLYIDNLHSLSRKYSTL